MNRKIVEKISKYRKEMRDLNYNLENIFLVLNENVFKRKKFEICGFPVIYDKNVAVPFCFIEFKRKVNK